MNKRVEFGLEMNRTAHLVVPEHLLHGGEDGVSSDVGGAHELKQFIRDGDIYPPEDAEILTDPFRVVVVRFNILYMLCGVELSNH